jgi:hypothetical protein
MKIRIIILIAGILISIKVAAQEEQLTETLADMQSYNFLMQKNWEGLIIIGNKALSQNIDFYYLRARLGIAYYESGQYALAIPHLKKALRLDANIIIREYLYYAYLLGSNETAAAHMAANMPSDVKRKLELEGKLLTIGLSAYYQPVANYSSLVVDDLNQDYSLVGKQSILKSRSQAQISFRKRNKTGLMQIGLQTLYASSLLRLQDEEDTLYQSDGRTFQQSVILNNSFKITDYLNLLAGTNIILGNTQSIAYYEAGSSGGGFGGGFSTTESGYYVSNFNFSELVLNTGMEYKSAWFDIPLGFSFMRTNGITHLQTEFQNTIYPFANQNLYINTGYIGKLGTNKGYLFKAKVGVGLFNRVWLETLYWSGDINHFTSDFGSSVFNSDEKIRKKMALNIMIPLKQIDVYFTAEQYTSDFPYYYEIELENKLAGYKQSSSALVYAGIRFKINK